MSSHGQEQPAVVASYMLDDPMMWIGLSSPIELGRCGCEARCGCDDDRFPTNEED